jgi:hypothetical protein
MKEPLSAAVLTILTAAAILALVFDGPAWVRLLLPFLTLAFFLKAFVRGTSRRTLKDSTNLGGGQ